VTRKQREAADEIRSDTLALYRRPISPRSTNSEINWSWETRIFEDRRRVIKFVCEVPTAIDQRLFALGRTSSRR
jgi:hypothetical protein